MTAPIDQMRLNPSDDCIVRELGGEMVLLDLRQGTYFGLNDTGTRIWKLLAEGRSGREVVDALEQDHAVPREQLESDVLSFLGDLLDNGIATARDPQGGAA